MKIKFYTLLSMALCFGMMGCAGVRDTMRPSGKVSQWNPASRFAEKNEATAESEKPAQTMAIIWSNTALEKPGVPAVKGFGGRIYFYDEDNQAVKADGELVVYGFDDSNDSREVGPKADRKYVFKAEKFQTHFSETDLGQPSYNVWVPWEKVGGLRKTITLIPVFKPTEGSVLRAGQSTNILPGKEPKRTDELVAVRDEDGKVHLAGYVTSDDEGGVKPASMQSETSEAKKLRTSTFSLTPGLASQLAKPQSKPDSKAEPVDVSTTETKVRPNRRSRGLEENETTGNEAQPTKRTRSRTNAFGSPGSFN
jgi:hypothetical protein